MRWKIVAGCSVVAVLMVVVGDQNALAQNGNVPTFAVDASWPSLPNGLVLGQVASVTVDARDHVWVLHRPRTVDEAERANAAPPVLNLRLVGDSSRAGEGRMRISNGPPMSMVSMRTLRAIFGLAGTVPSPSRTTCC